MTTDIVQDRTHTIFHDFTVEHEYEVIVRAVGPDGTMQALEHAARNTIVIQGKLAVPDTPIILTAAGFLNSITLTWTNPLDHDFSTMEIWRSEENQRATAAKIAEVRGISYIDPIGTSNATRYYWIRAVNTSGKTSDYYPRTAIGVGATTLGVVVTDIDDFAVTATKMFNKTIILTGDAWANNSPGAGSVAWNAHSIVYNGAAYPISAGNTANAYIYWTIGGAAYSSGATHPALGITAFMIAINTSGTHTLVWNSSANMVIGTAFIANLAVTDAKIALATITSAKIFDLDVDKLTANAASTNEFVSNTAQIKNAIINDAKITGTITVGKTDAKCTDALADQTGVNTAADTAKVQGSTIIVGGYIATAFLTATNIQAGTLTGRVVQTAASGQLIRLDVADNTLKMYNASDILVAKLDDDATYNECPKFELSGAYGGVFETYVDGNNFTSVRSLPLIAANPAHCQITVLSEAGVALVPSIMTAWDTSGGGLAEVFAVVQSAVGGAGFAGNKIFTVGLNKCWSKYQIEINGFVDATLGFKDAGVAGIDNAAAGIISAATISGGIVTAVTKVSHIGQGGAVHADVIAAGADGFMTGADKTKLNSIASGAQPGTVTSVTGSAPVASSGGTTPAISMLSATAARHGYMTLTFASKLNGIDANADVTGDNPPQAHTHDTGDLTDFPAFGVAQIGKVLTINLAEEMEWI